MCVLILFTGKYSNINFKMKIRYFHDYSSAFILMNLCPLIFLDLVSYGVQFPLCIVKANNNESNNIYDINEND